MTGWVIVVDQPKDFPNADTPHKVITTSEYLARPRLFEGARPKLVNLSRSYVYQSKGYYASLLAEARGHRVVPTVETMLELREVKLYEHALPELEDDSTAAPAGPNSSRRANSSCWSASGLRATPASRHSASCCSIGSAVRPWR